MTPEERHQGAFVEFDQLLSAGSSVDEAISTIFGRYGFERHDFRLMAEKYLGDLNAHRSKMVCRGAAIERQAAFTISADELRKRATARVQNVWDATMPFDPPGQPDWHYCFDRFVEDLEDGELRQVAHEAFFAKLKQLETKQRHEDFRRQNAEN